MASSPDSAPSGNNNNSNNSSSSSPPSKSPSSGGNSPPPPSSSSSPPPSKSPPPSSPPPSSPPPKSESPPPPDSKSSPPSDGSSPPPPAGENVPSAPAEKSPSPPAPTVPSGPGVFTPPAPAGALTPPDTSRSSSDGQSYKSPSSDSSSTTSDSHKSLSDDTTGIITGVIVGGVVLLAFLVLVCIVCSKKKKRKPYPMGPPKGSHGEYYQGQQQWNGPQDHVVKLPPPPNGGSWGAPHSSEHSSNYSGQHPLPSPNMNLGFNQSQFSYEDLAAATGGFSDANILGQGGFGYVHKGVLPNGREVAVKSLKTGSGQGEREFQAEVEIISRVHHRHLVSLVGYSIADAQRMLVYEYVPNKTLEFHLHGKGQPVMDWPSRIRIAVGSAKGLAYLHEDCHPKIIHRDIKSANILLDNNYEAMVADFGLAKLSSDNFTHVSTRVMGTFGYLAPEYAQSGKLSDKSDVFSFGVMLLELITGRKPFDPTSKYSDDGLVDWARPLMSKAIEDGNYSELVDPRLEGNYDPHEMAHMVASAAASVRHSARRRPKMSQIVRSLEGDLSLDDLSDAGVKGSQSSRLTESQVYNTGAYNADMMKFRKMVLDSDEFTSD